MNVLITGGAGFIGSSLTLKLLEGGHKVKVLDSLSLKFMERFLNSRNYSWE